MCSENSLNPLRCPYGSVFPAFFRLHSLTIARFASVFSHFCTLHIDRHVLVADRQLIVSRIPSCHPVMLISTFLRSNTSARTQVLKICRRMLTSHPVKYKLIYFDARAIAEVARQLFALAGQPYEDVRLNPKDWKKFKKDMPFEQLPVLEVDGKRIAQSYSICRFLARRFGFAGQDPFEEAVVDSIVDQFRDYLFETRPFLVSLIGVGGGDKTLYFWETLKRTLFLPERAKLFGYMKKFLRANPSGYLVGDSLTWADLCLSEHVATYSEMFPEMLEGYPEIKAHTEMVRSTPLLKQWIEKRPKTKF